MSPSEFQPNGDGQVPRMVGAVGLNAVIEVVSHAWLSKDADVGREIVLNTQTSIHRPLYGNAQVLLT